MSDGKLCKLWKRLFRWDKTEVDHTEGWKVELDEGIGIDRESMAGLISYTMENGCPSFEFSAKKEPWMYHEKNKGVGDFMFIRGYGK